MDISRWSNWLYCSFSGWVLVLSECLTVFAVSVSVLVSVSPSVEFVWFFLIPFPSTVPSSLQVGLECKLVSFSVSLSLFNCSQFVPPSRFPGSGKFPQSGELSHPATFWLWKITFLNLFRILLNFWSGGMFSFDSCFFCRCKKNTGKQEIMVDCMDWALFCVRLDIIYW